MRKYVYGLLLILFSLFIVKRDIKVKALKAVEEENELKGAVGNQSMSLYFLQGGGGIIFF